MPSAVLRRDSNGKTHPSLPRVVRFYPIDPLEPPVKPHKVHRGTHHLLVQLKLARRGFVLYLVLSALALLLLFLVAKNTTPAAPHSRRPFSVSAAPAAGGGREQEQHRLLLATHNRLAWYYPYQDTLRVLHEGEGVHYGMFPGDALPGHPHTVWNVIRPHNWKPSKNKEHLVLLDADTGAELRRVQIPSRFTHDAVRMGDRVYLCSTGNGTILELSYPNMTLLRSMPLFSIKDHPNTLAAGGTNDTHHLWVLLHNLGESDLVKVYVGPDSPPHEVRRITAVGAKAHGLLSWGRELIMLDSDTGALVSLDPHTGDVFDLYMIPEEGKFLKGLAVLDDIAYFGVTTWAERSVRDSPNNQGELAAYDLVNNRLLWRRTVATAGLLNIIGAPHLAIDSTYAATYSTSNTAELLRKNSTSTSGTNTNSLHSPGTLVLPDSKAVVQQAVQVLIAAGFAPKPINPTDYWSSGWPRLNPEPKLTDRPEEAGLQLPLFHANITALKSRVLSLPDQAWSREWQAQQNAAMSGRQQNQDKFKPGVEGIILLFSDNKGDVVYEFPAFSWLREELQPLLLEILGPTDIHNIVRLQLARMAPGESDIKAHQDVGGYAKHGHRIHVPLTTHPLVAFSSCPYGDPEAAASARVLAGQRGGAAATAAAATGRALLAAASAATDHSALTAVAAAAVTAQTGQHADVGDTAMQQPAPHGRQLTQGASMPRPAELLPIDVVGNYYTGDAPADADAADSGVGAGNDVGAQAGGLVDHTATAAAAQAPPALAMPPALQQRQRWQRQQQPSVAAAAPVDDNTSPPKGKMPQQQRGQMMPGCTKLYTPEGLVFELNNRVLHKVSNPLVSGTTRIHLVIDVFETPKTRTPLAPGSECEYGSMPVKALQRLQQRLEEMRGTEAELAAVTEEIRALVASPEMTCVGPDGVRVKPRRQAGASGQEVAEAEEEMVQQLLAQLQAQRDDAHAQGATTDDGAAVAAARDVLL